MAEENVNTRKEFEKKIIQKAWDDEAYLKRLLNDPKKVLQEELLEIDPNIILPDDLVVKAVVEDKNNVYIVIPPNPKNENTEMEISDAELSEINGGSVAIALIVAVAAAVVGAITAAAVTNTAAIVNVAANVNAAANVNITATTTMNV